MGKPRPPPISLPQQGGPLGECVKHKQVFVLEMPLFPVEVRANRNMGLLRHSCESCQDQKVIALMFAHSPHKKYYFAVNSCCLLHKCVKYFYIFGTLFKVSLKTILPIRSTLYYRHHFDDLFVMVFRKKSTTNTNNTVK